MTTAKEQETRPPPPGAKFPFWGKALGAFTTFISIIGFFGYSQYTDLPNPLRITEQAWAILGESDAPCIDARSKGETTKREDLTPNVTHKICNEKQNFLFYLEYDGKTRSQSVRAHTPQALLMTPGSQINTNGCQITFIGTTANSVTFCSKWRDDD